MEVIFMKTTGIVRRVDELGRIVIPKEIRTRMKMDSGDLVDICVNDEQVVLSKFHPLERNSQLISSFCDSLKETFYSDIIITDLQQITYNTFSDDLNGCALSDDFLKRVHAFLEKEVSSLNKINLTEGYTLEKDALIYEIMLGAELYGYLLILDGMLSRKQRDLADFILKYLNRVL